MKELAFIERNDVYTTTWVIAENIGYPHKSIVKHIAKHEERFEGMGGINYSARVINGRGQPTKPIALNETQAVFLMTLLNNTEKVLDFKQALSMEFIRMRRLLLEKQTGTWQQARLESKDFRKMVNDAIKELLPYAVAQGSTHSDKMYISYAKLIKGLVGYEALDLADTETLAAVTMMLRIVRGLLMREMALGTHYKAIYQVAKVQLASVMTLWTTRRLTA